MTEDARTLTFTVDELVRVLVAEHEGAQCMTTTSEIRHRVLRMWHVQQLAPLKSYRPPGPRQYDTGASSWKSPHFTTGASPVGLEIAALIGASAGERVAGQPYRAPPPSDGLVFSP